MDKNSKKRLLNLAIAKPEMKDEILDILANEKNDSNSHNEKSFLGLDKVNMSKGQKLDFKAGIFLKGIAILFLAIGIPYTLFVSFLTGGMKGYMFFIWFIPAMICGILSEILFLKSVKYPLAKKAFFNVFKW